MRLTLKRSCSLLLTALLLAMLLPAVPASARPQGASRPSRFSLARVSAVRTLAADDDFPGVAIPASPFTDSLLDDDPEVNPAADLDDIFKVHLEAGQTLQVSLDGPAGDVQFEAMLWPSPNWESPPVAFSDGPTEAGDAVNPQTLTFTAGTSGDYYLDIYVDWGSGSYTVTYSVADPVNESTSLPIDMKRIAGTNRYATALAVSQAAYTGGGTTNIILATGANFADALAASALAGSYDAPILLTLPTSLSPGVLDEIDRLRGSQAATVAIVGGTAAVSDGVARALTDHGNITVKRFSGGDRYGTAAAIAAEVHRHETQDLGHLWSGDVFVARGDMYPDALAAAPIAFARKMPILLVRPTSIPAVTAATLPSVHASRAFVLGSTAAVSSGVMGGLGVPATRLEGPPKTGRLDTAVAIADYAVTQGWATAGSVGITTGWNFPDALGGGVLIGKEGGVMLLTDPRDYILSDKTWDFVFRRQTQVTKMRAFGSNATNADGVPLAVGDDVFPDFLDALKTP